jgi:large subunit ribosomal protein L35
VQEGKDAPRRGRRFGKVALAAGTAGTEGAHLLQLLGAMPKMKTHSGAKKRFRKTASGKLRARHAFTSHNLGKKAAKRKRRLGRPVELSRADHHEARSLLAGRGR